MRKSLILSTLLLMTHVVMAQRTDSSKARFDTLNNQLKTVTVKAPAYIERQIDKTVLNVQNDLTAAGSTLFEILQKAPGISITNDDAINMSGKAGVNVLIDGKSTQLSQRDLANFLRSTPGTMVDKVEIISNPSSRFDAQGNAGIINIRLKRNKLQGTNGSITASYTQQIHYRANAGMNISHRNGKVNVFGTYNYGNNLQHTTGLLDRNITTAGVKRLFANRTTDVDPYRTHNFRAGADLFADSKNTFGMLISGNSGYSPFKTIGTTTIGASGNIDSTLNTINENTNHVDRLNFNLNYRHADTLGNELNIDADHYRFRSTNDQQVRARMLNKGGQLMYADGNDLDIETRIRIYSVKADLTRMFRSVKGKLEAGVKLNHVNTTNDLQAAVIKANMVMTDTGRSNDFHYRETVVAAYANYGQQVKRWEYQIGVRAEHATIKGRSVDLKDRVIQKPDTAYLNLFPSAFVRYTINDNNMIGLSFSSRIGRPNYQDLNPFESIMDAFTSEKGNPYLRPAYSNNAELSYTYRNALSITLGYGRTTDQSQLVAQQIGEKGVAQQLNVGGQHNYYLNLNLPIPIASWWYSYVSLSGNYNTFQVRLPDGHAFNDSYGMNWYMSNSFTLGKGWKAQLSSWGNAATRDVQFRTRALGSLDLGMEKSILKNKGSIRMVVSDIFNTQRWRQTLNYGVQDIRVDRKWESRGIRLQCSWRFGDQKFKARERRTASEEDSKRIKSK